MFMLSLLLMEHDNIDVVVVVTPCSIAAPDNFPVNFGRARIAVAVYFCLPIVEGRPILEFILVALGRFRDSVE